MKHFSKYYLTLNVHKALSSHTVMPNLGSVLNCSWSRPAGSKSDGQKSPSDSVFLRMDEIPYMRTECLEEKEGTGE